MLQIFKDWVPAFRLRAPRFGGLEPAEAREASVGWVAGMSGYRENANALYTAASFPLLCDRRSSQVMIDTFTRFQPRPLRNAAR